mmetsp:Transcript_4986/g.7558  ORF Transcript_4986/g.7558 Transcript_4986/m.7558 type:complete len:138 (-) Transcript_4986:1634-2047(-)
MECLRLGTSSRTAIEERTTHLGQAGKPLRRSMAHLLLRPSRARCIGQLCHGMRESRNAQLAHSWHFQLFHNKFQQRKTCRTSAMRLGSVAVSTPSQLVTPNIHESLETQNLSHEGDEAGHSWQFELGERKKGLSEHL